MSLIIIIATIWGISALISHIKQARLAEEQKRQREAQARLLREQRAYAQAQREETARLIALEKARQAQEKMNEKFEREQARQAEQLAKHEETLRKHEMEIRDLKHRMTVCEDDYKALKQRMENLNELYELASAELASAESAGDNKRKEKALRKIMTLDNQIAATEKRMSKAKYDWNTAKKKLAA